MASLSPTKRESATASKLELQLAAANLRVVALQSILRAAEDSVGSPFARLMQLSRLKANAAVQGMNQQAVDAEFKALKLIRVPAPNIQSIVCAVCSVLVLGDPARLGDPPAKG